MIKVSGLFIYPVKSCRGISLAEAEVATTGFANDRQWLVVDRHGVFMTQRDWPTLAQVSVAVSEGGLRLQTDGMAELVVHSPGPAAASHLVTIWRDDCLSVTAGPQAAEWFTDFLGTPCQLVWLPPSTVRPVDPGYADRGDRVGFADGFPFLLISQASLDELNSRLDEPVSMDRFRPNIVVEGCPAHSEDDWLHVTVGEVGFRVAKPCARCVITTTDQITGVREREPLRTLATYRRIGRNVLFGQNLIHDGAGTVRVGDECRVGSSE